MKRTTDSSLRRSIVGLDQLNILLPRSLAGRGEVELSVLVDGQEANKLKAAIK